MTLFRPFAACFIGLLKYFIFYDCPNVFSEFQASDIKFKNTTMSLSEKTENIFFVML